MKNPLRDLYEGSIPDEFYATALREFVEKRIDEGVFARAVADSDGSEAGTRALYIRYRAKRLASEAARSSTQQRTDRSTQSRSTSGMSAEAYKSLSHDEKARIYQEFLRAYPDASKFSTEHAQRLFVGFLNGRDMSQEYNQRLNSAKQSNVIVIILCIVGVILFLLLRGSLG